MTFSRIIRLVKDIIIVLVGLYLLYTVYEKIAEQPISYNCSNFRTYDEAVRVFKKNASDIYHLDANHDGRPCEMLIK